MGRLLGVFLQGLLQRVHGQAVRRGGELRTRVGAAGPHLGGAVVGLGHHGEEGRRGLDLGVEVLHLLGHRHVAGAGRAAAVEQAQGRQQARQRLVHAQAVAVLGNLARAHAQHLQRFEHGARRDQLHAPGIARDGAVLGQACIARQGKVHAQAGRRTGRRDGLHRLRLGGARRVGRAVGVAPEDLREQRVGPHAGVGHQPHTRRGVVGVRRRGRCARVERAVRKHLHLGAQALLQRGQVQQFEEGALAHEDLARVRVGLGQQARAVAVEPDLARRVQIHQPRLQVVRMRRQDGVRQQPAAHVAPGRHGRGRLPRGQRLGGQGGRAARQRGRGGEHGGPAEDAQKGAALHGQAPVAIGVVTGCAAPSSKARLARSASRSGVWGTGPAYCASAVPSSACGTCQR